jgi:hypothetical protein
VDTILSLRMQRWKVSAAPRRMWLVATGRQSLDTAQGRANGSITFDSTRGVRLGGFAGVVMFIIGSLDALWGLGENLDDEIVVVGGQEAIATG